HEAGWRAAPGWCGSWVNAKHPVRDADVTSAAHSTLLAYHPIDRTEEDNMLIVDSQIHIWKDGKMSAHHRQVPTYSYDDALAEMKEAGVDCAVLHPPSALGE